MAKRKRGGYFAAVIGTVIVICAIFFGDVEAEPYHVHRVQGDSLVSPARIVRVTSSQDWLHSGESLSGKLRRHEVHSVASMPPVHGL